jgi:hypothetical protein
MGLLDSFFGNADQTQALGLLGANMMAGNTPGGFQQALGLLGSAPDRAAERQLRQMQMQKGLLELDDLKRKTADAASARQVLADFYKNQGMPQSPVPVGGPTNLVNGALPADMRIGALPAVSGYQPPAVTPKAAVWQQYKTLGDTLAAKGLVDQAQQYYGLAEKMRPKFSTTPQVVRDPNTGKLVNVLVGEDGTTQVMPYGVKPEVVIEDLGGTKRVIDKTQLTGNESFDVYDPNKPFGMRGGQPVANADFQKYEIGKARAGATNVKIENKLGEGIAAQVGPMLKDSFAQANGAAGTVDAANRIISAADSGKLFAGPGATFKMKTAQLADVLGVAGKDTSERISNTRQAIRGLAEMTLQGRKQMRGEGQITEGEQALAERAMSGNLEDLTTAEVRQLAAASDRAARFIYGQHEQMVGNLGQDPNTAGLAKFYKPMPLPAPYSRSPKAAAPAVPQPGAGVRFLGFEGQ